QPKKHNNYYCNGWTNKLLLQLPKTPARRRRVDITGDEIKATTFGGRRGAAGEEGYGRLAALRRPAGLGHLGEAVIGADVEWVGRVGTPGVYLLAVAIGHSLAHCNAHDERNFLRLKIEFCSRNFLQG